MLHRASYHRKLDYRPKSMNVGVLGLKSTFYFLAYTFMIWWKCIGRCIKYALQAFGVKASPVLFP